MLLPSEISEKFDDVLKPSSELHNRWRQKQLHFWTTGISLQVKTEFKTIQTLSTNNDTKPLQCHSMAASQTYYYPCPHIGTDQKNTGCKMRERAKASSWRMLEEKDSSEEAQEAIVSKWDGHTYLLRLAGSTTLDGKSKRKVERKRSNKRERRKWCCCTSSKCNSSKWMCYL
jgi:hypothetical protein